MYLSFSLSSFHSITFFRNFPFTLTIGSLSLTEAPPPSTAASAAAGRRRLPRPEDRVKIRLLELLKKVSSAKMVLIGAVMTMISGTLVYYHCAYRESSVVSLLADVFIVLLCSLAILGLLFRHMNIAVPVDPLHWQISQDAATSFFACLANTLGATESVLRVAATGHDKRLFLKVVSSLYLLSIIGRALSGAAVAYIGLCLFCLYVVVENSHTNNTCLVRFPGRRDVVTANSGEDIT
ncbi:hypothetical protein ACS0TY_002344 [Phlomoides rotata]